MHENHRKAPPLPGLPPGAQQPAIPSPTSPHAFDLQISSQPYRDGFPNPWHIQQRPRPNIERPRGYSMHEQSQSRPRTTGDEYGNFSLGIGQANVYRSVSNLQNGRPMSDGWSPLTAQTQANHSFASFASLNASDYWNEVRTSFRGNYFKFNLLQGFYRRQFRACQGPIGPVVCPSRH